MPKVLIDAGPIGAYYNGGDDWHRAVTEFLTNFRGQFVTTEAVVTEVMFLLMSSVKVQNEFLLDLAKELYSVEHLLAGDFKRIAELNTKYSSVPADFAALSLIVVSERLGITDVVSLDSDFDIYRQLRKKPFKRLFPK